MFTYLRDLFSGINLSTLSITSFNEIDALDILIVSYFIYKIMVWIKETRAWSLFKGVVVVAAVSGLAYVLRLNTVSWLMLNAFNVGLIAVVVLFQPELRKALEQLGRGRFLSPLFADTDSRLRITPQTVNEIIKAAEAMADVKTGALIVIEEDVALGDHEQTGIPVDAIVSSQLLLNIFENKTPLHDGAVIVRNNRVAAATCILPLTQVEIGRELGTRHRAAVGASEVSDAHVLVVSEETGAISIAHGGNLYRNLTGDQIRQMLCSDDGEDKKKLLVWRNKRSDKDRAEEAK